MTYFEALKFNQEPLNRLISLGFRPDDCHFINLYADYENMRGNGEKVTYIVSALAVRYRVSERKVYNIIKRFGKHCTMGAV